MTLDGRVIIHHYMDNEPPRAATMKEAAAGIVIAAKHHAMPELLELLPAKPEGARGCPTCRGERWQQVGSLEVVCGYCGGLGWASEVEADTAP